MINPTRHSTHLAHSCAFSPSRQGELASPPLDLVEEESLTPSLSVIFPAFNEEANIRRTVESARAFLPKIAAQWEIIVVDDGSKDTTRDICDELIELYPEVRAIHHPQNRGYGAALKSGILAAQSGLIFFTDSDGQFDLLELESLIRWSEDYDIVLGYRGKRQDPPHRLLNAFGWNLLVRLVLGVKVRDIDCAFKLFRREVFDRIQIRSVGAMVNTEILAQATSFGMRMREIRVSHYPRQYGTPSGANLRVIVKAFRELGRLWRQLRQVDDQQEGLFYCDPEAGSDRAYVWDRCASENTPAERVQV